MMNNPLLQRYVMERSEPAFTELVRQNIDLVYSAALRQVNSDPAAAQDVTQAVFTDLARKAPRLLHHPSLTGWLYTSTRYIAAKARRSEQRRTAREQEAYAMNQLLQSADSDPAWEEWRPVLDEAMHELGADDREALLLRFFEHRPLAEVGARLGLTEDTARKRVARALEKLRDKLVKRGITSTVAILSVTLAKKSVAAAPAGMAEQISHAALATGTVGSGVVGVLWKILALAGAAVVITGALVLPKVLHHNRMSTTTAASVPAASIATAAVPTQQGSGSAAKPLAGARSLGDTADKLVLHIVTADSGQPVPSVELDYWLFTSNNVNHNKPLLGSLQGVCEVPVPRATTTELILVSQRDGFANTRLQWHADRGETIPMEYTLRLARAVSIGGTVVDADGNPVADAEVGFNNHVDPALDMAVDTSDFNWPFWFAVKTDAHGHWRMSRMTRETLRTVYGSASHPSYLGSDFEKWSPDLEKRLLDGTHEFRLGRGAEARGTVVDANGQPIQQADVMVGYMGTGPRQTTSNAKGQFHVGGCPNGKTVLTAVAKGYAPTTIPVDLSTNTGPFRLELRPGKLLRLRVADTAGMPVPRANVWLNSRPDPTENDQTPPPVQADISPVTDGDGTVVWADAPDRELSFDVQAAGYMRVSNQRILPDGQEHLITLPPALTISGAVRDASTGQAIPQFRVIAGWPEINPVTGAMTPQWSSIDRFWLSFVGGKFRHTWNEAVLGGTPNPGYIFKFEADGHAPFVTRPVALNEGEVQFDVSMQPAASTTVTVTLADGQPAAGVDVGVVSPNARLELAPGGFSRDHQQSGGHLFLTDSRGQFVLKPDDSVTKIIAADADGFAQATRTDLASNPVMVLQPWGRLEGTLLAQGKISTNGTVLFQFGGDDLTGVSTDFNAYQVRTDGTGHFAFAQVPPGKHKLVELVEVEISPSPTGKGWAHMPLTNVVVQSGETTTITVESHSAFLPASAADAGSAK